MKSTVPLGRIAGIAIGIHYSWLFILGLITWSLANGLLPSLNPSWEIWRIELVLSGGRPIVELRFDGMGLGRMSARSVTFTRGSAVARLIISAYGRIRRE